MRRRLAAKPRSMPNGNRITLLHPSGDVGLSVAERTGVDLWSGKRHAQNRQSCDLRHIVRGPEGAENVGLGEHSSRRGPVWPELPWPEVREARAPRPQHRLLYQHFEAPSGHVAALLRVRTSLAARRHGGRHDPLTPRRSAEAVIALHFLVSTRLRRGRTFSVPSGPRSFCESQS